MILAELISRLEMAEGGSRELDGDINEMFNIDGWKAEYVRGQTRAFTTSIDAAVALAENLLKVYRLDICMDPSGVGAKVMWWPNGLSEHETAIQAEGLGWTISLSICLAILKALQEPRQ